MDSITQAVLGAAIGEAILGQKIGKKGAFIGAAVATIPDLDVALYLFYDSFEMLSIHRGISHSILLGFIGASLIAFFLKKITWTSSCSYKRLWLFSWLALFTHVILDTFTAYGTQLFLPFSDKRVGFDSINVVDPVYTIPMIVGLILSLFFFKNATNRAIYNKIGLAISSFYLLATLVNKTAVNHHFESEFTKEKINYTSLLTMPVGIANVQWYGVAKDNKNIYIKKYSYFQENPNPTFKFAINDTLLNELTPILKEKMKWFSKGFYTVTKDKNKLRIYNLQVDMRGVIQNDTLKAPTHGYFEITISADGSYLFSSGAHENKKEGQ
jgi:inner membrane protein